MSCPLDHLTHGPLCFISTLFCVKTIPSLVLSKHRSAMPLRWQLYWYFLTATAKFVMFFLLIYNSGTWHFYSWTFLWMKCIHQPVDLYNNFFNMLKSVFHQAETSDFHRVCVANLASLPNWLGKLVQGNHTIREVWIQCFQWEVQCIFVFFQPQV